MQYLIKEISEKTAVLPENLQQEVLDFVEFIVQKRLSTVSETALLSEQALANDWERPEEEDAWAKFQ